MRGSIDRGDRHDYWESVGERRSADHPVVRAFAGSKIDFIIEALPRFDGRPTMLEVGAGSGFFSLALSRSFDLTCLDFSRNMLERNPVPAGRKVLGDAESLGFGDGSFDVVFSANLLHHLGDPVRAVSEMARVARRHVVLVEPNVLNPLMLLFGALARHERGVLRSTPGYLRGLGLGSGLRLRRFASQGSIVPNRTPRLLLPLLVPVERTHPVGFYNIAVFDVAHGGGG